MADVPDRRTVTVATPVASTAVVASVVLPDINVTVPVGAAELAVAVERTTEMSVSCWPPVSDVVEVVRVSVVGRN